MTEQKNKYLAAVLIRGLIGVNKDVKDTLRMMNMIKKFSCIVVEDNPVNKGMMNKCKDYITYGELSVETLQELDSKRKKQNNHYALPPPRGGFERMGTKTPYTTKGALGYRGDKMNDLIKKMI
ncbi:MAG: uL30 family ribosomal protein [Candidatus Woesearchaeota archaeon]|jgi:large subunit ribosomal protein L30